MTFEIALLLVIISIAMVLFSFEPLPADVIALGVLVLLVLTGLLPVEKAFEGIGSDTFVMILGLLVITAALVKTGVVDIVGRYILLRADKSPTGLLIVIIMMAVAILSTFMSNTGATAFFLPIIIGLAHELRISRSKLLLPLAFASILASSVTLISTSTNIVISSLITDFDMRPFGMFELTPVGLPILVVGLMYMYFIGHRLVPDRPYDEEFSENFGIQNYLTELYLPPDSPLCGKTLARAGLGRDKDITVVRVIKNKKRYLVPTADLVIEGGDLLLVEGPRNQILKMKDEASLVLKTKSELIDSNIKSETINLFEVILLPRSLMIGRTLEKLNFRQQYKLQVLGINRSGRTMRRKLGKVRLKIGDQLLIQGNRASVIAMDKSNTFRLLNIVESEKNDTKNALLVLTIFIGVLALAALNIIPLPIAVVIGMLLVFATRCITPEEAYRQVEWRALILIGSMLVVGTAMQYTGTAAYLAAQIVNLTENLPPVWLLGGFFILSMLISQPMSNQAAAVVVVPIAIQTAIHLGLNPRTFAVMISVGASCSFLTPLEPACLMVYGPGNYHFADFLKVGSLLTVLVFVIAITLVPLIWPL
ncbi:MAG TPA: SLC13 family permease [Anaerolineae bacterium]|nr:SLC13 family permease [Anaerolineae bacterium]